jgi:hypothetical protein
MSKAVPLSKTYQEVRSALVVSACNSIKALVTFCDPHTSVTSEQLRATQAAEAELRRFNQQHDPILKARSDGGREGRRRQLVRHAAK